MVVDSTNAFGKSLLSGIPHCLSIVVQAFSSRTFFNRLREYSQQAQAVIP